MTGTLIWSLLQRKHNVPLSHWHDRVPAEHGWVRRWSRLLKLCFRPSTAWPQAKLQEPMRFPQTWRGTARLPYCFLCIVPQDFRDAKIITLNNNWNNCKGISFLIIAGKVFAWIILIWLQIMIISLRMKNVLRYVGGIIGYRPSVQILRLYEIEWRINPGWR